MSKLQTLIDTITKDDDVKRFKELETIIDQNKDIQEVYKQLLNAQKVVVKAEHTNTTQSKQAQTAYQDVYRRLVEFPLMQEYLDLLEQINTDLNLIQTIIEGELTTDFD